MSKHLIFRHAGESGLDHTINNVSIVLGKFTSHTLWIPNLQKLYGFHSTQNVIKLSDFYDIAGLPPHVHVFNDDSEPPPSQKTETFAYVEWKEVLSVIEAGPEVMTLIVRNFMNVESMTRAKFLPSAASAALAKRVADYLRAYALNPA